MRRHPKGVLNVFFTRMKKFDIIRKGHFDYIFKVAFSYDIVIRLFRVVEIIVCAELNDWLVNT